MDQSRVADPIGVGKVEHLKLGQPFEAHQPIIVHLSPGQSRILRSARPFELRQPFVGHFQAHGTLAEVPESADVDQDLLRCMNGKTGRDDVAEIVNADAIDHPAEPTALHRGGDARSSSASHRGPCRRLFRWPQPLRVDPARQTIQPSQPLIMRIKARSEHRLKRRYLHQGARSVVSMPSASNWATGCRGVGLLGRSIPGLATVLSICYGRPPWRDARWGRPVCHPPRFLDIECPWLSEQPLPPSSQKTVAANPESALAIQKANSVRNSNALVAYKFISYTNGTY